MRKIFLLSLIFLMSQAQNIPLKKLQAINSLPLNNSIYYQYSANFQLGTPAQNVSFVLDNSESVSWVSIINGNYKINQSTSAVISQNSATIDYGLGQISGRIGTDLLACTSMNITNITQSLLFGSIINNTGIMVDGILGLSNDNLTQNFIQLAVAKGQVSDPLFAFYLTDTTQNNSAQFYIGSTSFPASKPLTWISTTMTKYWSIPITNTIVAVQSYTSGISTNHAIVDSASSLLLIGKNAFNGLIQNQYFSQQCQLNGNQYICPCPSSTKNLAYPTIRFVVSSSLTLTAVPMDYMLQLSGSYCLLGIQNQGQLGVMIFGDILMNNYLVGFDKSRSRIGFSSPNRQQSMELEKGFLQ